MMSEQEKLYQPSQWSPFASPDAVLEGFVAKATEASAKAKQSIQYETVSYGPTEKQKIDIFGASLLPTVAPMFVFIHGGFWIEGSRDDSSFMVEPLFNAGLLCCIVGYELVPKVTVDEIVEEIKGAVSMIIDLANSRNSKGIYICGHSAGAHLAAMLLSTNIFSGVQKHIVKGLILLAGIFDLTQLTKIPFGKELLISKEIADKCSPVMLKVTAMQELDISVVAAKFDSPAFVRQSHTYYQFLQANGINARYTVVDEDHFSLVIKLAKEDYIITKVIIQMANSRRLNEIEMD